MKLYELEKLTKEFMETYWETNYGIDIKTKTGTIYHIIKTPKGKVHCFSQYCYQERKLTKEMKKVFC